MQSKDAAQPDAHREVASLDGRYGKIGISAVAAAMRYGSDAKNPAYAPSAPREDDAREDERFVETAAG